jgi:aminopeptidase YwaD
MKKNVFVLFLSVIVIASSCQPKAEVEITLPELQSILEYIATDSLKGRYPGTAEDMVLAEYLSGEMKNAGATLQATQGKQFFDIPKGVIYDKTNRISFADVSFDYKEEAPFVPLGFSANDTLSAEIAFAGDFTDFFNMKEEAEKLIKGKWLMLFSGYSSEDPKQSSHEAYINLRSLGLRAADHSAAGVIYISQGDEGVDYPEQSDIKRLEIPIPALMVSRKLALNMLNDMQFPIIDSDPETKDVPEFYSTGIEFTALLEINTTSAQSFNSTAMVVGSVDSLAAEFIVIGAHHDHLGWGGRGTSSRQPDTVAVHYGADDNASGVAGVLELAEYIGYQKPARSFSFLTFGGEEMGLVGSKYFAENPTIDLEKVQTMINLDMIGRLKEDRQIQIGGMGTSPIFRALIDTINMNYNFNLKYSEAGYGPSDHSSFYAKDIPVLFISTGAHTDYHTPSDNVEKINFEGMQELLYFVSDIAMELANMPEKIEFTEAGPKTGSNSRGRRGGVTFGLMPEMTYDGNDGMPVTFVTEGKPAAAAGMKGGDIIKEVDGKSVGNVYDYMERLGQLKAGQAVIVKVERDKEELELLIQL